MGHDLVTHKAFVHIGKLMVTSGARGLRQTNATMNSDAALFMINDQGIVQKILPQHIGHALI